MRSRMITVPGDRANAASTRSDLFRTVVRFLGPAVLLVFAAGACAAGDARSVNESRAASPEGRVRIETVFGTLEVSGWAENKVEVTGSLDRRATLSVETSGDIVSVKVEWPKRSHFQLHDPVCDLAVRIPARGSASVEVVSAETKISGISGAVEVESVSGGVRISGDSKRVEAQIVSGDLQIDGSGGRISAEAVSGNVTIQAPNGDVEGQTVSGRVTLQGGPFDRVKLEAVSGEIEFAAALTSDARVDISNHSGDVDFLLRGTPGAEFDVSTFSGDIRSEFGGESHRAGKYAPGEEYNHTEGGGGPRISIEAFSGNVHLRKQ